MVSLLENKNITLISINNKEIELDFKISLISPLIKSIISDSDNEKIEYSIPVQFTISHLELLKKYINYLLERSYEWNFNNKTVEFYIEQFNKYEKGQPHWMVKRYIDTLNPDECVKLYEISKYLDIKLLQEELIKN